MKIFLTAMLGLLLMFGSASAQDVVDKAKDITGMSRVTSEKNLADLPKTRPAMIYVQDFDLEADEIKHKKPGLMHGPVSERVGNRLRAQSSSPEDLSVKLVDSMAEKIVANLKKKDIQAQRIAAGAPLPKNGWLVRGVFTQVDEGNRIRRVALGFGSGETKIDLHVNVIDLTGDTPKPFYSVDTAKGSGKMPGALPGAIISFNPYVTAAQFVLNKNSLKRDVRRTASTISGQLAKQIEAIDKKGAAKAK